MAWPVLWFYAEVFCKGLGVIKRCFMGVLWVFLRRLRFWNPSELRHTINWCSKGRSVLTSERDDA